MQRDDLSTTAPRPAFDLSWIRDVASLAGTLAGMVKHWLKEPFYVFYLRRLRGKAENWRKPRHIGLIMDGNRRFARTTGLPSAISGHHRGAEKLREVLDWCSRVDIRVVTVWCFSIDNFQRSTDEVEGLLSLFETKTREMTEGETVHDRRIRVRYIGRLDLLPESLQEEIARLEAATAHYDRYTLNIAMAYGGREEITDAMRQWLRDQIANGRRPEEIAENLEANAIEPYLYTSGQPEPDLILRTSGEVRMSGFLLWQSAYSEFYFSDANWPAFREIDFLRALRAYDLRQRRFGR
ncbi:MAG: polyprenyl diphosphate synthase [Acidobacteriota bacterium]